MLSKIIIVFFVGLIETFLYAGYIIAITKKQVIASSLLMFIYMCIYLIIISYIIKDVNTIPLLIIYSLSCGIGNFLRVRNEK